MIKRLLPKLLSVFPIILIAALATSVGFAATSYIPENSSNFSWGGSSGLPWLITSTGRGGQARQYLQNTGGNFYAKGTWTRPSSVPGSGTQTWQAWIPTNGGSRDALVAYKASSTTRTVDQQLYANQWVSLFTVSGGSNSSVSMANSCVSAGACFSTNQVWWDDLRIDY